MSADPSRLPPPHWTEKDGWPRHPQTAEEWDWDQDGPENDPKERSRLRLAFGADLADPRAPDQMALVLRVDLSRVVSELVWRRAQVEMYQGKAPAPSAGEMGWRPIRSAPKDGTMLQLLVEFTEHATDDSLDPCATIGMNNLDHDGEDVWKFAGWDWCQDCFTQGEGTPLSWMPLASESAALHKSLKEATDYMEAQVTWPVERERIIREGRALLPSPDAAPPTASPTRAAINEDADDRDPMDESNWFEDPDMGAR